MQPEGLTRQEHCTEPRILTKGASLASGAAAGDNPTASSAEPDSKSLTAVASPAVRPGVADRVNQASRSNTVGKLLLVPPEPSGLKITSYYVPTDDLAG